MAYYRGAGDCMYGRGDYYRGDYYRGDPGLGSFFKKVAGAVGKALIPAPVRSAFELLAPRGGGMLPPPQVPVPRGFPGAEPGPGFVNWLSRELPGGASGYIAGSPYSCGPNGMPRGRWNKSTYVVRGGGTSRWGPAGICQVIPKGTVCVKPRRMNVANPRALRRALRRASGFAKLARRYVRVQASFKKGGKRKKK